MRLGLLSQWFDPEPGGGAVPGVLARGLVDRGHEVTVLTGFPNYPTGRLYPGYRRRLRHTERPQPHLTVHRAPLLLSHDSNPVGRSANYLSFGASARSMVDSVLGETDAVWVYNSPATVGAVARGLARRQGVPFLLHVMDLWPDSVTESGMLSHPAARSVANGVLGRLVARTHHEAALVAVTSPGQVDLLAERGVPRRKLRYIPVWANEEIYYPRPRARDLLPAAARHGTIVLMYAGAMGHVQRLDGVIRAAAAVGDDVHLVMVGSGMAESGLRALAGELQAANVHFMGQQPADQMGDLTAAADLHLVSLADTPLLRVTMPSKLLSIMASARPILATCAGDASNVVESAKAGIAVPPGEVDNLIDHLRHLLTSPAQLNVWANAARSYYEREFSRELAVTRVEDALRAVEGNA